MRVAVTGTPCVGKTTLAALLRERGETVVDLKQWAAEAFAIAATDDDGTLVIDTNILPVHDLPESCFIEGHMAHHLDVDAVWLVRCDPHMLSPRLDGRGYSPAKIRENLEAEAMDLILQESLERPLVVQRDGTHRSPAQLLAAFDEAKTGTLKGHDLETVDWSNWLMENP